MDIQTPTEHDLYCANFDSIVAGLECFHNQVMQIKQRVKQTGLASRDQVSLFLTVATESHGLVPNAFTQRETQTGVTELLGSLESESQSIVAKIVQTLKDFLSKIWSAVVEYLTGRGKQTQAIQKGIAEIEAHVEVLEELKEPDTPSEPVTKQFEATMRSYTELTALLLRNQQFRGGLTNLVRKIPAHFQYLEMLIKDYERQVTSNITSEASNEVDSESIRLLFSAAMQPLKSLNSELKLSGLKFSPEPIVPSDDELRPDEIVAVRIVSQNAEGFRNAISDLRQNQATIHNRSEMDQLVSAVDALNELVNVFQSTLVANEEISSKVLDIANGFANIPPLSKDNQLGNKFDFVRLQTEFIRHASKLFLNLERAGDVVLADAKAFISSTRFYQSERVKAALAGTDPDNRSKLQKRLRARLDDIAEQFE